MAQWSVGTGSWGASLILNVNVTSQDVANNTSTIAISVVISGVPSSTVRGDPVSVSVSGIGTSYSGTFTWPSGNKSRTIASFTRTVTHNAAGAYSTNVAASIGNTGTSGIGGPTTNGPHAFSAPTIARASTPSFSSGSVHAGSAVTINTNRASTSFTHTLKYAIGSASGTIATGVGASTSWTPPVSLLSQIPNTTTGAVTVTAETYSGSTLIGTRNATLTITAGPDILPDFTTVTHSEATTTPPVSSLVGAYVQGVSSLNLALTGEAGIYGSTIVSRRITVGSHTINAATGTTGVLNTPGAINITGTVTDSRGRSRSKTIPINVINYASPPVHSWVAQRALADGTPDNNGTKIRVDMDIAATGLLVGTQKNHLRYRLLSSPRGENNWSVKADVTLPAGSLAFDSSVVIGDYDTAIAYDVRLEARDIFRTTTVQTTVGTSFVLFHYGASGVGAGKYHEQGSIDAADQMYQNGGEMVASIPVADATAGSVPTWNGTGWEAGAGGAPAGTIFLWTASAVPDGYLACEGQAVSRTTYSDLFAIIGSTYGGGNGSTTFNVPDLRGRVPVGFNSSDTDFNALNKASGAKTHTLTVAEMPSHDHHITNRTATVAGHASGTTAMFTRTGSGGVNTQSTGGGGAHNNMQPYRVVRYIIKASGGVGNISSTVESVVLGRLANVENTANVLTEGRRLRRSMLLTDTTGRTATTTWTLGPTFAAINMKAHSQIKLFYSVPLRNDSTSWGGGYVEPQVSYDGGSTWQSLGSTGHDGSVMSMGGGTIATYSNTLFLDPGITSDFTVRFRFYFRSYDGTLRWNANHAINTVSGTAPLISGAEGNQHYMHIIVDELATGV